MSTTSRCSGVSVSVWLSPSRAHGVAKTGCDWMTQTHTHTDAHIPKHWPIKSMRLAEQQRVCMCGGCSRLAQGRGWTAAIVDCNKRGRHHLTPSGPPSGLITGTSGDLINPHSLATSFFNLSVFLALSLSHFLTPNMTIHHRAGRGGWGTCHWSLRPWAWSTHTHTHESAGHCLCHLIWHRLAYRDYTCPACGSMIIIAKAMLCIIDIFRSQLVMWIASLCTVPDSQHYRDCSSRLLGSRGTKCRMILHTVIEISGAQ